MVYFLFSLLLVTFSSLAGDFQERNPSPENHPRSPEIPVHERHQKDLIEITFNNIQYLIGQVNKNKRFFLTDKEIHELSIKLGNDFFKELPYGERIICLDKMCMYINKFIKKYESNLSKPKIIVDGSNFKIEVKKSLAEQNVDLSTLSGSFIADEVRKYLKKGNQTEVTTSQLSKSTENVITRQMVPVKPLVGTIDSLEADIFADHVPEAIFFDIED